MSRTSTYVKRPHGAQRQRRQERAAERQAERAKRSAAEQIVLLDQRPGESKRERARLAKQVAA